MLENLEEKVEKKSIIVESTLLPRELEVRKEERGLVFTFISLELLKEAIKKKYLSCFKSVNLSELKGQVVTIQETITKVGEIDRNKTIRFFTFVTLDVQGYHLTRYTTCEQDNIQVVSIVSTAGWINNEGKMETFPLPILRRYGLI